MTNTQYYTAQSIILAITPKIPAMFSIIGSSYIVQNVIRHKEKRCRIYNRLMFGISVSDICASHAYFLGTWLIPKGSGGPFGPVFMAIGNNTTCSYSGFFNQMAIASPLYNVMLSTFYLLKIRYNFSDATLQILEPYFHGFPIAFALGTSLTALGKALYGNVFWTCWINPNPPQEDFRYYQWFFLFAPVWICIIYQIIVMTMVWWTMRSQEQTMTNKYKVEIMLNNSKSSSGSRNSNHNNESHQGSNHSNDSNANNNSNNGGIKLIKRRRSSIGLINERKTKHSKMLATQGILYVCAFFITWLFPTIQRITELCCNTNYFALQALDTTLLPLQGLFNVLIYLRPKYIFYRKKHPALPFYKIFQIISNPTKETRIVLGYSISLSSSNIKSKGNSKNNSNSPRVISAAELALVGLSSNPLGRRHHHGIGSSTSVMESDGATSLFRSSVVIDDAFVDNNNTAAMNDNSKLVGCNDNNDLLQPTTLVADIADDGQLPIENIEAYQLYEDQMIPDIVEEYPDLDFIDYRKIILEQWITSPDNPANYPSITEEARATTAAVENTAASISTIIEESSSNNNDDDDSSDNSIREEEEEVDDTYQSSSCDDDDDSISQVSIKTNNNEASHSIVGETKQLPPKDDTKQENSCPCNPPNHCSTCMEVKRTTYTTTAA